MSTSFPQIRQIGIGGLLLRGPIFKQSECNELKLGTFSTEEPCMVTHVLYVKPTHFLDIYNHMVLYKRGRDHLEKRTLPLSLSHSFLFS